MTCEQVLYPLALRICPFHNAFFYQNPITPLGPWPQMLLLHYHIPKVFSFLLTSFPQPQISAHSLPFEKHFLIQRMFLPISIQCHHALNSILLKILHVLLTVLSFLICNKSTVTLLKLKMHKLFQIEI